MLIFKIDFEICTFDKIHYYKYRIFYEGEGIPWEFLCGPLYQMMTGIILFRGFPGGSDSKESAWSAGDMGLISGLGISPGEGYGNPLPYSCL